LHELYNFLNNETDRRKRRRPVELIYQSFFKNKDYRINGKAIIKLLFLAIKTPNLSFNLLP